MKKKKEKKREEKKEKNLMFTFEKVIVLLSLCRHLFGCHKKKRGRGRQMEKRQQSQRKQKVFWCRRSRKKEQQTSHKSLSSQMEQPHTKEPLTKLNFPLFCIDSGEKDTFIVGKEKKKKKKKQIEKKNLFDSLSSLLHIGGGGGVSKTGIPNGLLLAELQAEESGPVLYEKRKTETLPDSVMSLALHPTEKIVATGIGNKTVVMSYGDEG
jgi:hypothetical protein